MPHTDSRHRHNAVRCAASLVGISALGLFLVASQLEPNPQGLGTHQQLGLPPCTMRVLWDLRCPACGMTTSWTHFVRGQWLSSLRVNAGGFLLALLNVALLATAAKSLLSGAMPGESWQKGTSFAVLGIAIVTVVDWAGRVALERFM